jgi:hypothetical protein
MMPRRYRIILWAAPLILLQWFAMAVIDPQGGRGGMVYVTLGFFFGTFFGQTTLAAAWAALGPGPLRWRLPLSLAWVAMLPMAIFINIVIHGGPKGAELIIGGCLFGQWLIVQLPLWGLATVYGVRLRHVDDIGIVQDRRERQFGIRHLMIATTIVGVTLGMGRILVDAQGMWFGLALQFLIFVFLAVAAIALTLPLLLAGLLPRRAIPAVLLVLTLIGLATAWELTLFRAIPGVPRGAPDDLYFVFICINAFTAATILAGVAVLRLNGYGILLSRRPGKASSLNREPEACASHPTRTPPACG